MQCKDELADRVCLSRSILGDNPRPVGSVRFLSAPFPAGFVSRSRILTFGSARDPTTEASQPAWNSPTQ